MAVNKKWVEFTNMGATVPAAGDDLALVDISDTTDDPTGTSKRWEWLDFLRELFRTRYAVDAGANDTYVATLVPTPAAYETGGHYRFKANTANTGACTINFNSLGAKTIKKAAGGITTDLADNDIRAGQWVDLVYDGTNMQMQSTLGNTSSGGGSPGGSNGDIQYRVDASTFGGGPLKRLDANTTEQQNTTNAQRLTLMRTWTSATNFDGLRLGRGDSGDIVVGTVQGSGGGTAQDLRFQGGTQITFYIGTSSPALQWELNSTAFQPSNDNSETLGTESKRITIVHLSNGVKFFDNATNSESPFLRRVSGSLELWDNDLSNFTFLKDAGRLRVATQFDKTNTTLATVTGLTSQNLKASTPYRFEAELFIDADATGGFKFQIAGTATATSIIYQIQFLDNAADTYTVNSRHTALSSPDGNAGPTAGICRISGMILVNATGTISVQFAQNAASGTSSVLVNSTFRVEKF